MEHFDFWRRIAVEAIEQHSAFQHPDELGTVLTMLDQTYQPKTILEIGGGNGGTAWAFAQLPSVLRVITVTLPNRDRMWLCCPSPAVHTTIYGDSTHGDTLHSVLQILGSHRPGFVFIDGDHTYKTASSDLAWYGQLVEPDGLIGLHDILPESRWIGFEVDRLWAEIPVERKATELIGDAKGGMGTGLVLPANNLGLQIAADAQAISDMLRQL